MTAIANLKKSFSSTPWCSELLSNPDIEACIPPCRVSGKDKYELWQETLNTSNTIREFLALHTKTEKPNSRILDIKLLANLRNGLDGFPGVCHGGMITTLLDESMVSLILINVGRGALACPWYGTVSLNMLFQRPVKTPATVLVAVNLDKVEGRKLYITATLQDGSGKALVKASAVFIGLDGKL
ncbi:HotDog domain-containing protein [Trichoderma evansii]